MSEANLSYVQNKILSRFHSTKNLRYSDISLQEIDRDLFNYHLKFLIDKGYIEKDENKNYLITELGKKYVQQLDVNGNVKRYFKLSVLTYVVKVINGKRVILLHKRLRHPYFGDVASVSGKILYGEQIEDAASRKLKEETGLICDNFKLFGVHRKIRLDKNNKIIEDTLYHCCYAENPDGELISENEFGENFWADFDTAIELQRKNITASKDSEKVLIKIRQQDFAFFYFQEQLKLYSF